MAEYLHTSYKPDAEYVNGEIDGNWLRKERFEVAGSPIYLSLDELFQQIAAEEA